MNAGVVAAKASENRAALYHDPTTKVVVLPLGENGSPALDEAGNAPFIRIVHVELLESQRVSACARLLHGASCEPQVALSTPVVLTNKV